MYMHVYKHNNNNCLVVPVRLGEPANLLSRKAASMLTGVT